MSGHASMSIWKSEEGLDSVMFVRGHEGRVETTTENLKRINASKNDLCRTPGVLSQLIEARGEGASGAEMFHVPEQTSRLSLAFLNPERYPPR